MPLKRERGNFLLPQFYWILFLASFTTMFSPVLISFYSSFCHCLHPILLGGSHNITVITFGNTLGDAVSNHGWYGCRNELGNAMNKFLFSVPLRMNSWFGLFGLVLWYIDHCWLFKVKSSSYIYIKYIWFGLVGFYGISNIVCYLMPNPLYTYILDT